MGSGASRTLGSRPGDFVGRNDSQQPAASSDWWVLNFHSGGRGSVGVYIKENALFLVSGNQMTQIPFSQIRVVVHREKSRILAVEATDSPIELKMPADDERSYLFKKWILDSLIPADVKVVTRED